MLTGLFSHDAAHMMGKTEAKYLYQTQRAPRKNRVMKGETKSLQVLI